MASAGGHAQYLLIDDLGEEHPWPSSRIFKEFDAARADYDPLAYAVRNLGFVLIVERPGFLRLRLRPLLVSSRAVAAMFYCLAERRPPRSAIAWFDDAWHDELCGGPKHLYRRLTEILHRSARSFVAEPFLATRRSLDAVLNPPGHPFAPLLKSWLNGSRDDLLVSAQQQGLWERAMVAEQDPVTGVFRFRHSGGSIQLYGSEWSDKAVGRRVSEQPDSAYGRWIEDGCAAVNETNDARVELVHAAVTRSDGEVHRWRYERLMLPFKAVDGRRMVMSVSARDPGPGR
ncbi:MAG TPA: hypothetical protein VHM01_19470 [Alphaproteobacteria bacterium]|nr:hypothetical protein [Alphaproteobacteria bacterium]